MAYWHLARKRKARELAYLALVIHDPNKAGENIDPWLD